MQIKNNLKEILQNKGIKQNWVSSQLDISNQYISNICANRDQPTLLLAFRIAYILNVDITDIFYLIDVEEKNN